MKKILIIFLLAIVACSSVEIDALEDIELINAPAWLVRGYDIIRDYFKKARAWLEENKLWDPLYNAIINQGRTYGMKYCTEMISQEACEKIVDGIIDIVKKLSEKEKSEN